MATEKATRPAVDCDEELVPVKLFKDGDKYKDDVFVAVNGEHCKIQRGKTVMIKRKFARVLEQSHLQDTATEEMMAREEEAFRESVKKLG